MLTVRRINYAIITLSVPIQSLVSYAKTQDAKVAEIKEEEANSLTGPVVGIQA